MRKTKKMLIIILLSTLLSLILGINQTARADVLLSIPETFQEHSQWCWAGTSQAVLAYYGSLVNQCDIANWAWNRSDCCGNPTFGWPSPCNQPNSMYGEPGSLQDILTHWGVDSSALATYLSRSAVVSQIDTGKPFVMRFGWTSGGGHFLDGCGYDQNGYYLDYVDPWPGNGNTKAIYDWVVSSSDHNWTHTLQITTPNNTATLSVAKYGTGSGTVTSSPSGINCGSTCSASYEPSTSVTLTATPASDSIFTGWSGGACSGTGTCTVTMNPVVTVNATFAPACTYALSPTSKTFPSKGFGLSTNVTVTGTGLSTCPAPIIVESLDWATATLGTWNRNKGTVKITVLPSTQSSMRTGSIAIGDKTFTVRQTGAPCTVTALNPTTRTFPGIGGEQTFTVTTSPNDCPWRATTTQSWVHITGGSGVSGGTVTFNVDRYTGSFPRSGSIVVQPLSGTFSSKKTFTVRQTK